MIQLALSIFGICIVNRTLSLLEKFEVINRSQRLCFHILLQLPFIFFVIFKELQTIVLVYIGIFLIILIAFRKLIAFLYEKHFEKMHLVLIQRLLLHISRGHSPQNSFANVINSFSPLQKRILSCQNEVEPEEFSFFFTIQSDFRLHTLKELNFILNQTSHVTAQLKQLRQFLSLRNNLRHKSRQILLQSRAQACVCVFIYAFFWYVAVVQLGYQFQIYTSLLSPAMFLCGFLSLFNMGRKFKWKT